MSIKSSNGRRSVTDKTEKKHVRSSTEKEKTEKDYVDVDVKDSQSGEILSRTRFVLLAD